MSRKKAKTQANAARVRAARSVNVRKKGCKPSGMLIVDYGDNVMSSIKLDAVYSARSLPPKAA